MDNHLFITFAKRAESDDGMACGPVPGAVFAEAGFRKADGEEFFISCAEVEGIPNFYKTDRSVIDEAVYMDENDRDGESDFWNFMSAHYLDDIGEYDEIFEEKDPEWFMMLRYLISIIGNEPAEAEAIIQETVGKYLDEIEIPVSPIEEDYMEDEDEEE